MEITKIIIEQNSITIENDKGEIISSNHDIFDKYICRLIIEKAKVIIEKRKLIFKPIEK